MRHAFTGSDLRDIYYNMFNLAILEFNHHHLNQERSRARCVIRRKLGNSC